MKLTADLVGVQFEPISTELTERNAMCFAASVGDNNPWYFDDERPDGIVVPPMQAVALTWPLAVEYSDALKERGYGSALRRQVHYTEHLSWHRPMKPGEVLEIGGEIASITSHVAGTYALVKFEARDSAGDPVFTEYSGALFRAVRYEGEGGSGQPAPEAPAREEEPEARWTDTLHIDPLQAHIYDGCTDLHFPIHTSRRFAHKVGLPDTIIHGTCTLALAVRELVNREADGDPTRLRAVGCRFTGMVYPDTDVLVRMVGESSAGDVRNVFFDVMNTDGKKAVSEGFLTIG